MLATTTAASTRTNSNFVKQMILRVFTKKYGLSLKTDAVKYLLEIFDGSDHIPASELANTIEWIASGYVKQNAQNETFVSQAQLEKVMTNLQQSTVARRAVAAEHEVAVDSTLPSIDPAAFLQVLDVFQAPKLSYNANDRQFTVAKEPPTIFGSAAAKIQMFRDRFDLIKQRLLRNDRFRPPAMTMKSQSRKTTKIIPIKTLRGCKPGIYTLFGMISIMSNGKTYLEDPDESIEIENLKDLEADIGFFTETSFVVVTAEYTINRSIKIKKLEMPPIEPRAKSLASLGSSDKFFGGQKFAESEVDLKRIETGLESASMVILSDVHLDSPAVLARLRTLFRVWSDPSLTPPIAFVLMGNFTSTPYICHSEAARRYRDAWSEFAELLSQFPQLIERTQFIFVPGPGDPSLSGLSGGAGNGNSIYNNSMSSGSTHHTHSARNDGTSGGGILPRATVPEFFRNKLRRVLGERAIWATNPCRIQYCTKQFVVFREDMVAKLRRNALVGPNEALEPDHRRHLAHTVLSQAHLTPLPLSTSPVYWGYDHSLRLYPVPDILILADRTETYTLEHEGVKVANPGSLTLTDYGFLTCYLATGDLEECHIFDERK